MCRYTSYFHPTKISHTSPPQESYWMSVVSFQGKITGAYRVSAALALECTTIARLILDQYFIKGFYWLVCKLNNLQYKLDPSFIKWCIIWFLLLSLFYHLHFTIVSLLMIGCHCYCYHYHHWKETLSSIRRSFSFQFQCIVLNVKW